MSHEELREVLDRGTDGVGDIDFVDTAWAQGMGMRRRREVLTAAGLVTGAVVAGALVLTVLGGGEVALPEPAEAPTTTVDSGRQTNGAGDLIIGIDSVGGLELPAPGAEVTALLNAVLGDPGLLPGRGIEVPFRGGCTSIGRVPSGSSGGNVWSFQGWGLGTWGPATGPADPVSGEGSSMVDEVHIYGQDAQVELPYGLELGQTLEDARRTFPVEEEIDAGPGYEAMLRSGNVRAWFLDDRLTRVKVGPTLCGPAGSLRGEIDLGPGTVNGHTLPASMSILGEIATAYTMDGSTHTEAAASCPDGTRSVESFPGLRFSLAGEGNGRMIEGWSAFGEDPPGRTLPFGLRIGMTYDEARAAMPGASESSDSRGSTLTLDGIRAGFMPAQQGSGEVVGYVEQLPLVCTSTEPATDE